MRPVIEALGHLFLLVTMLFCLYSAFEAMDRESWDEATMYLTAIGITALGRIGLLVENHVEAADFERRMKR
jgi:hypothetical protein